MENIKIIANDILNEDDFLEVKDFNFQDKDDSFLKNRINVKERFFSKNDDFPSIGIANFYSSVPEIEVNKEKIIFFIKEFKKRKVNIIIFPEFSLSGYFWDDQKECWPYMEKAVVENHIDWIRNLEKYLDNDLEFIIFNNIRKSSEKKFFNSTFVINKKNDYLNPKFVYDKILLPGIEKVYSKSGLDDRLVIDTKFGRFGFTTCYDFCFSQIIHEYAMIDKVDAIIQIASWRSSGEREYPTMNIYNGNYYGELWDMFMKSRAATNQVWVISCNAVGTHKISEAEFWGGSGLWAPSGLKLIQSSHTKEELLIIHNIDIKNQRVLEKNDFNYSLDFSEIYRPINGKRTFTRIR